VSHIDRARAVVLSGSAFSVNHASSLSSLSLDLHSYNLKKFPDEPVKVAEKEAPKNSNPVLQYLERVMNPLNASGIKE
jgi:hypothetical protein